MRRSWRLRRGIATAEWLSSPPGTGSRSGKFLGQRHQRDRRGHMGKGILLWLIGIPLPIIILLLLFWR
ncbi:hypothetical protein CVN68_04575 [Sphingomonas psychrotolerans]|uniref:Uncharacterized protein n=1 Tax=Sphingomonas psychrotolerans TaxID=1327635 RepID=A0A2K8MBS9_9SPHN|nr:hypothetical protein CVN68_04575 [Sphingomonas psychrotolerans]